MPLEEYELHRAVDQRFHPNSFLGEMDRALWECSGGLPGKLALKMREVVEAGVVVEVAGEGWRVADAASLRTALTEPAQEWPDIPGIYGGRDLLEGGSWMALSASGRLAAVTNVRSSVSAALLKEAGYDVTGVFIKVWQPDWMDCNWREDRLDAVRVAAVLDIPFITLDLEKEYKRDVVDYMIAEYKAGRTPNPCVMCNQNLKFGRLIERADQLGAQYVATGHFARVEPSPNGSRTLLKRGRDLHKDQSYFLFTYPGRSVSSIEYCTFGPFEVRTSTYVVGSDTLMMA